jgi:heat shock protein beta
MKIIINSLYKNRDIFLRELISNASDALDKIRFLSLTDSASMSSNSNLNISIAADPIARTLTITDSGVGMTRQQLKENLGTIAKSGTSEFLAKMEDSKKEDVSLIGQFGVGFYSVFLVADKVSVASKSNDDPVQHVWVSDAVNDFTIAEDPRGNTLGRGSQITLHLKEDATEFLDPTLVEGLISRYSEFINFPIFLWKGHNETIVPEQADDDVDVDIEEEEIDAEKKTETEEITQEVWDWNQVNTQKPIWTRSPKDIADEEYIEFYKTFSKKEVGEPISWSHFKGEGDVDFRAIMYIPPEPEANFYQSMATATSNVKLFIKRVFITDDVAGDFFPKWLSFLQAIVDAEDLPLNVSRETLQQHKTLRMISKRLIKKALDMFAQLAKSDEKKYTKFIQAYGSALKYGAIESNTHRKRVASLLRFQSSKNPSEPVVGLDAYLENMKPDQKNIFYASGMTVEEIQQSPFLERLIADGYEVLFFTDPIDEMLMQNMPGYDGKMFSNIAKGDIKFGDDSDEAKAEQKELEASFKPLQGWLMSVLSQYIDKVTISKRLATSPMAIVTPEFGLTGHMEKLLAAQGMNVAQKEDTLYKFMASQKKTLELNPNHPIIKALLDQIESGEPDEDTTQLVTVLYETTAIRSGFTLKDMRGFTQRIEEVVGKGVGADVVKAPKLKPDYGSTIVPEELLFGHDEL